MNEDVKVDRTLKSVPNFIIKIFADEHEIDQKRDGIYDFITHIDILNILIDKRRSNNE